jgi:hypothetical protein
MTILSSEQMDAVRYQRDNNQRLVHDYHLRLFRLSAEWGICKDENRRREIQDDRVYVIKWLREAEEKVNMANHQLRMDAKARLERAYGGAAHQTPNNGL